MCVQLRKTSPASTHAYYQCRLVPPGAHMSVIELPLVPIVKNRYMSTLNVSPSAANRLHHALLLSTRADFCLLGLIWLILSSLGFLWFLWFKLIMCRPFNVCSTAANRLQHALLRYYSRLGSFVFYVASLGSCGLKSLCVDPEMCVQLRKISLASTLAYY